MRSTMKVWIGIMVFLSICSGPYAQNQAFLCLYGEKEIADWIECLQLAIPADVYEEMVKLRKKYYKEMPPVEVTLHVCENTPQLLAKYPELLRKFLKKIPSDVMDRLVGQLSLCANNTAFRFPPKDKDGKDIEPYDVTIEDLPNLRGFYVAPLPAQ